MKKFKCIKSTASSKGGFINKLSSTSTIDVFGVKKTISETYYLKTDTAIAEGKEDIIPMEMFKVEERPFEYVDETTGEVTAMNLKWLHAK